MQIRYNDASPSTPVDYSSPLDSSTLPNGNNPFGGELRSSLMDYLLVSS